MSTYSIGSMNQLGDALENAGFSNDDVTKLKQFSDLKGIKNILHEKAEIKYPEYVIDCDAVPAVGTGFRFVEHKKYGSIKFDLNNISLYLSKEKNKGNNLRNELGSKKALNVIFLDFLLAHEELIPDSWKSYNIFFWGTIYSYDDGRLFVPYLYWDVSRRMWAKYYLEVDNEFSSDYNSFSIILK